LPAKTILKPPGPSDAAAKEKTGDGNGYEASSPKASADGKRQGVTWNEASIAEKGSEAGESDNVEEFHLFFPQKNAQSHLLLNCRTTSFLN
jgi:hypothetical protein